MKRKLTFDRFYLGLQNALNRFNRVLKTTVPKGHDMEQDLKRNLQSDPYDFLKYLFEKFDEAELAGDEFKFADLFTVEHKTQWTCDDCGQITSRAEASAESGMLLERCTLLLACKPFDLNIRCS